MNSIYEAELNLEWWNSKSPAYKKRYLQKHPNSIYADKVKSGELEVDDSEEKTEDSTSFSNARKKELNEKIDKLNDEWQETDTALDELWKKRDAAKTSEERQEIQQQIRNVETNRGRINDQLERYYKDLRAIAKHESEKRAARNTPEKKLSKIPAQREAANQRIEKWTQEKDKAWNEYIKIRDERAKIPEVTAIHDYGTDNYTYHLTNPGSDPKTYSQEELKKFYDERDRLRGQMRSLYAQFDNAKHNIEVAERYKRRLQSRENFTKRLIGPNTTEKYKDSGVAQYVDFSGMSEDTEREAMDALEKNIKKYPFMKNHLTFVGSHKSQKFKELSQQLAHDYYYDAVQKSYDEAKDYIRKNKKGYFGPEKDPEKMYADEKNWDSEAERREMMYSLPEMNRKYKIIQGVDKVGGIENFLRQPAYQKAIDKWKKLRSNTWAFYRTDTLKDGQKGMISFNENNFDAADLKHNVETKWHPEGCDTRKAVLDHEFAHSIWYQLGLNKKLGNNDYAFSKYDDLSPLQKYIKEKMWMGQTHVKNNLSGYAATNPSEFFAEALSEYLNNPHPRKIAQEVGKLLEQEIKERGLK